MEVEFYKNHKKKLWREIEVCQNYTDRVEACKIYLSSLGRKRGRDELSTMKIIQLAIKNAKDQRYS